MSQPYVSAGGERHLLRARLHPEAGVTVAPVPGLVDLLGAERPDWPGIWRQIDTELVRRRYARGTRCFHRQVLRQFSRFWERSRPRDGAAGVHAYVHRLGGRRVSWIWIAMNIAVLRTVFDKLGGLAVTEGLRTPRRGWPLPGVLSVQEVARVLAAAPTLRDQLLLGLLYGCGLKVGETCALRWRDVDLERGRLRVGPVGGGVATASAQPCRELPLPRDLLPILAEGVRLCAPGAPVFPGRRADVPLTTRAAEFVVRRAGRDAGLGRPLSAMALRHSFALHALEAGVSIRQLQNWLGHRSVETTLVYERLLPRREPSPLDAIAAPVVGSEPAPAPVRQPPSACSMFPAQPTIAALVLPFPPEPSLAARAAAFCRALRLRLDGAFLACRRRSPSTAGP